MPEPETPLSERPWEDVERMVSVDQALELVLASVCPLPGEPVPILEALGMVTACDVVAGADLPPFQNSAMDGYAVRSVDTRGATLETPVRLDVVGSIAAGAAPGLSVRPGQAIRIMTGASMPANADAVVRFEETDEAAVPKKTSSDRTEINILRGAREMDNVRPAGEDIAFGELAIRSGTKLRPQEIGLLAALSMPQVVVHRRPRVAILSTGDEVVDIGEELQPGQIRNSNSYTLAAMAEETGAIPVVIGIARDRFEDLSSKLANCRPCDLIVTSGGVSVGDYDMVKDVLRTHGAIDIWQVRMKPGKPLAFGRIGETPLLGLPGNPVAAAVSFEQFGKPAIRRMLGLQEILPRTVQARLTEHIDNLGYRRHYVRAILEGTPKEGYTVRSAGDQGAGVLTSLTRANALLVIPEHVEAAEPGMTFAVQIMQ